MEDHPDNAQNPDTMKRQSSSQESHDAVGDAPLPTQAAIVSQQAAAPGAAMLPDESPAVVPSEPHTEFALASVVESILFTSQKPVSVREILQILRGAASAAPGDPVLQQLGKTKETDLRDALDALQESYAQTGRSFEAKESASGWQLMTRPAFAPWLRQLFPENRPARLSAPALETLAIIAYRQPITRADIEAVRGVAVDGVMQTLLDRGLVKIAGRAEVPGRPLLYSTTQRFMEHFGLRDLCELPNASELRARPLPTASPPAADAAPPAGDRPVDEDAATRSRTPEADNAMLPQEDEGNSQVNRLPAGQFETPREKHNE